MPVRAAGLTAAKVRTVKAGRYGDGDGLYVLVRGQERAFWVFRYTQSGKMREMGLGRARGPNAITLVEARSKAGELHKTVRAGQDPLAMRDVQAAESRAAAQQATVAARTFRQAAKEYIAGREAEWSNSKHVRQWSTTLEAYAYPYFGDVPVAQVATSHVLAALEPIWRTKSETASRVRGRIEAILDAEKARGSRTGDNPAEWKGNLKSILPNLSKVAPVEHHAALPYAECPAFMTNLRSAPGVAARALEFTIGTAARTEMTIAARWGEIDLKAAVWTVPRTHMKGRLEFRVPLSTSALAVLAQMAPLRLTADDDAFVFPGSKPSCGLSNMAMSSVLRRLDRGDVTVHGFRSTFKDWASECTSTADIVSEAALAHTVPDKVAAAYRRGELFEKRRKLMKLWSSYCSGEQERDRKSTISAPLT